MHLEGGTHRIAKYRWRWVRGFYLHHFEVAAIPADIAHGKQFSKPARTYKWIFTLSEDNAVEGGPRTVK